MVSYVRLTLLLAGCLSCSAGWAQNISKIYADNCANCHGADGSGNTVLGRVLKLRDLRSGEVQRLSPRELIEILSKGAGRGKMPAFEKKLGAETISNLANYLREIDVHPATALPSRNTNVESAGPGTIYAARCAHCHAADGSGNTVLGRALKLHDIRPEVRKISDDELVSIISKGTDAGRMPGFQKKLGSEPVIQLASYVRKLAGQPPISTTTPVKTVQPETVSAESGVKGRGPSGPKIAEPAGEQTGPQEQNLQSTSVSADLNSLSSSPGSKDPGQKPEIVDLNSASREALMSLPGLTAADAEQIIAGRPYRSTLQFKIKNIVSPEKYAKIAAHIVAKQLRHSNNDASQ